MITLLHGDDIESSRNELNRLRNQAKDKEIRQLDGRGLTDTALTQALESHSLFGGDTLVIVENLFGKLGKKQKLIESLAGIITRSAKIVDVILWEEKEMSATVIKSLVGVKVQLFKTPVSLFQFLDSIKPGNARSMLLLYEKTLATHVPEVIYTMIVRRIRQLIQAADGVTPEGLQDWQASRLTSQSRSFTMEKLTDIYQRLLEAEYSIKTGTTPFTLSQLTEQILLDIS